MPSSLYIHIPFCIKRCIYCDFASGLYDPQKADLYINALKKELTNIPNNSLLKTLYIGGGTPTALSTVLLSDLIDHVFDRFRFTKDYEATIEINPGTVDRDKLKVLRSAGINRLSTGVQSFNNDELSFLGRIHSSDEAEHAIHLAREAGFTNIGLDLIYGIPGQDTASWARSLTKAVSLDPEHISTYELTPEEGTELHRILNSGPDLEITKKERDEDSIIEMYNYTIDFLRSRGYIHYEISNFAKPGHFSRHNLNYWDRGEYHGTGLGAHSFIGNKRSYNTDNLDEYMKYIRDNNTPLKGSEEISLQQAVSEAIFLGLRKTGGIVIESVARKYKTNIMSTYHKEIGELKEAGLIEVTTSDCQYETILKLTRKGILLSNEVFTRFI